MCLENNFILHWGDRGNIVQMCLAIRWNWIVFGFCLGILVFFIELIMNALNRLGIK